MRFKQRLNQVQDTLTRREQQSGVKAPKLRTPRQVIQLLEAAAKATLADPGQDGTAKAHALARLAAVALRGIEDDNLLKRIQALEAVLKERPSKPKPKPDE